MRIGVISDTHIPDRAKEIPKVILDDFMNVDMIIHAGDFVDLEVLEQLRKICSNVRAVCGNMDPEEICKKVSKIDIFKVGKFNIALTHGFGNPNRLIDSLFEYFKNKQIDLVIFGHSHNPTNETREGILFFNPGSPTDTIFAPYRSYGIIEINDKIEAKIIKIDG